MRAILTWHSLDRSGSPISVAPEEFRLQLRWLAGAGVRIVSVKELLELDDAADAAAVTFDDGFANFAAEAVPVLEEHGMPATVFIVTDHVGRDNRWGNQDAPGIPSLPLLGWDELGRLGDRGVNLGAHTRTHPRLPTLDAAAIDAELSVPAEEMERRLGKRPAGFAYPYGVFDDTVAAAVAARYQWACTTEFRHLASGCPAHRLPRLDAWYLGASARKAGWGSAGFRAWVWARRQGRRLRSLLAP